MLFNHYVVFTTHSLTKFKSFSNKLPNKFQSLLYTSLSSLISSNMGTRGIFQVYNASTETYTYYYIHSDSLIVLKELRTKLMRCKTLKGINKLIAGLVADGILCENQLEKPGAEPYSAAMCWPSLEYSLTIKVDDFTRSNIDEYWIIEPVYETLETKFALAKHQRAAIFEGSNAKNGEPVKKPVTKPVAEKRPRGRPRLTSEEKDVRAAAKASTKKSKAPKLSTEEKRPRGRPRLTQEEKDTRAAARTLLKLHEGPKAMAPRSELAPWSEDEITPDGLVC
jgi:hypothetical protein